MEAEDQFVDSLFDEFSTPPELKPVREVIPLKRKETTAVPPEVKNEQPWHRTLAYLCLQGKSTRALAEDFDKSEHTIRLIKRQKWFQELCARLAADNFDNDVTRMLEGSAVDAVLKLEELLDTGTESTQRFAAGKILDLHLANKPARDDETEEDPQKELDRLDAEIKRLES